MLFRHSRCLKLKVFVGGPPLFGVTINKRVERRSNWRCWQASVSSALIGESIAFEAQAESIRSWAPRPRQHWPCPALPPAQPCAEPLCWLHQRGRGAVPTAPPHKDLGLRSFPHCFHFSYFPRIPPTCQALFTPSIQSLPFFQGPAPLRCHWRPLCLP